MCCDNCRNNSNLDAYDIETDIVREGQEDVSYMLRQYKSVGCVLHELLERVEELENELKKLKGEE